MSSEFPLPSGNEVPRTRELGVDASANEFMNGESTLFAAKTTCWRRYGPPDSVRVDSAFAMFAATTSARIRSACIADPDASINPNKFTVSPPPSQSTPAAMFLFVDVNRVQYSFFVQMHESNARLELQLRFRHSKSFAIYGDVVAVRPGDQAVDCLLVHRPWGFSSSHTFESTTHLILEVHSARLVSRRIDVRHICRCLLCLADGQVKIAFQLIA